MLPPTLVPTPPRQVAAARVVTGVSRSPTSSRSRNPGPEEGESGLQALASGGPVAVGDSEPPSPSALGLAASA